MTPEGERALEEILPRLVKGLRGMGVPPAQAEDLVQNALTYLLSSGHLARFNPNGPATLFTYVFQACLYQLYKLRRREHKEQEHQGCYPPSNLRPCVQKDGGIDILDGLAPDEKILLFLRYWGGLTFTELGVRYGITRDEASKRVREAQRTLGVAIQRKSLVP